MSDSGITIVGLGPGDPGLLTRAAWEVLCGAQEIWVRTARHPTVDALPALPWRSFDALYEGRTRFEEVYAAIVDQVLELARRPQGVIYAVPGDPHMGEATVEMLRTRAAEAGLALRCLPGVSYLEPTLHMLSLDGLAGVALADAVELAQLHHPPFPPSQHAIVAQLYSSEVASDVKLVLMNQYPETHPVQVVQHAGLSDARTTRLPLFELDRFPGLDHLSSLHVPPLEASALEQFQETVAHLRAPEGFPWDREQTHLSLRPHMQEECYEVLDALDRQDADALQEELGDLLLQIILQTQIATEGGQFRMADVVRDINTKIVRRHPHVFGGKTVEGVEEVLSNWEAIKADERTARGGSGQGLLNGIPAGLPALLQADLVQQRAARVGFDWRELVGVLDKVQEEIREVQGAEDEVRRAEEVGDLLFAVVNLARWVKVEPESALREANQRFRRRFERMEAVARARGVSLGTLGLEELDKMWGEAKRHLS
ncbi:MAG TPA: nucleoside triphosphate pyrophosphohydrolase [Anaerolineales bacterium]|nr:nucleoside triphosphate pyrophosphohydrolase [Anaerolineales bacterium]